MMTEDPSAGGIPCGASEALGFMMRAWDGAATQGGLTGGSSLGLPAVLLLLPPPRSQAGLPAGGLVWLLIPTACTAWGALSTGNPFYIYIYLYPLLSSRHQAPVCCSSHVPVG